MVVDSSVLVAILLLEPERQEFIDVIRAADECVMSAASFVETTVVLESRLKPDATRQLDDMLLLLGIKLSPIDIGQALGARDAYRTFGKGNHKARLNFGDCFSYALAKELDEPLLFKGNDFSKTDVKQIRF